MQYASQAAYTKNFMLSFARANELFVSLPYGRLTAEAGSVDEWSASADGKQTPAADVEYRLFSGEILVNVRLQTPLDNMGALELEIFGYKKGVPFISMPKLHMGLLGGRLFVKDTAKNVLGSGVRYSVGKRRVWVRVPLKLLKEPDILFVSTRTAKEELSLDFGSWRILELEKQPVDR